MTGLLAFRMSYPGTDLKSFLTCLRVKFTWSAIVIKIIFPITLVEHFCLFDSLMLPFMGMCWLFNFYVNYLGTVVELGSLFGETDLLWSQSSFLHSWLHTDIGRSVWRQPHIFNTSRCNKEILMSPMAAVIRKAGTSDSPELQRSCQGYDWYRHPTHFICLNWRSECESVGHSLNNISVT